MADTPTAFILFVVLPFHFGAYKLHGRKPAAQMGFTSLPAHRKRRIMGTQRDTGFIDGIIHIFNLKFIPQRDISFFDGGVLQEIFINLNGIEGGIPEKGFELFDNTVGVFRIVFGHPCFNAGSIKKNLESSGTLSNPQKSRSSRDNFIKV